MPSANEPSGKQVMLQFVYLAVSLVGSGLLMKWATSQLDPNKENKKQASLHKRALQRRLGLKIDTDSHEDIIVQDICNPQTIDVSLDDVGGHQDTKKILYLKVIQPLQKPELFNSFLLRQPKGVLLYGPPGTGKTMLAKALAKEAGARFINIKASSLQSKWFGETQKLVHAVFSLAYKLQPSIVFIDEVDALLGRRRENEHDAITTMKTEFMQLWDGFSTDSSAKVMILAATNRPFDLDDAVLRRFTLQLEVPMPDAVQREAILGLILRKHALNPRGGPNVASNLLSNKVGEDGRRPQAKIAEQTDGFNGSDLLELCSRVAAIPIQECMEQSLDNSQAGTSSSSKEKPRDVQLKDFVQVLRTMRPATHAAEAYRQQMASRGAHGSSRDQDPLLAAFMQALLSGMANSAVNPAAH